MPEVRLTVTTVNGSKYRSAWERYSEEEVSEIMQKKANALANSDRSMIRFDLESGEHAIFNASHVAAVVVATR